MEATLNRKTEMSVDHVADTEAVADNTTGTLATGEGTSPRRRETVVEPTTGAALWKKRPLPTGTPTRQEVTAGRPPRRQLLTRAAGETCRHPPNLVDLTMCNRVALIMFNQVDLTTSTRAVLTTSSPVDSTMLKEPVKTLMQDLLKKRNPTK